ncbi:MAG: histidine kinase [Desulfuromonas sp.]|nr:MAG: histidine kinase [Desulfuromonas sp.]
MADIIAQILKLKGRDVWSIAADARVYDALELMAEKRVGALVVLEQGQVVGVFSERDYTLKVDLCGRSSREASVREVMSTDVYCVTPETSVDEAMAITTESRSRHLPVMENGELVGLTSIGDLVKAALDEKDFVIKHLNKYIKGEY